MMTSWIAQSWLGSALPSRWNLECQSGVLCCRVACNTQPPGSSILPTRVATHCKQVASSSEGMQSFT